MDAPVLSLITGTLNRPEGFARLVKSIQERTPIPWELIVSDASDCTPYTDKYGENVIVIPEKPRAGCVIGYNRAFSRARGKWIIYLNDDAEVMPGYATNAIDFMEKHPEIGLGCLYYCENVPPYQVNFYKKIIYANFGIISRELGEKVQYFDPVVRMYGNDNSLTFRVLLEGKGVVGIPNARIWHHSILDKWKIENQKLREGDAAALMEKYGPYLDSMYATYCRYAHLQGEAVLHE